MLFVLGVLLVLDVLFFVVVFGAVPVRLVTFFEFVLVAVLSFVFLVPLDLVDADFF